MVDFHTGRYGWAARLKSRELERPGRVVARGGTIQYNQGPENYWFTFAETLQPVWKSTMQWRSTWAIATHYFRRSCTQGGIERPSAATASSRMARNTPSRTAERCRTGAPAHRRCALSAADSDGFVPTTYELGVAYSNTGVFDPTLCNCNWNPAWCDRPSIDTMWIGGSTGRACGDYSQLFICVG